MSALGHKRTWLHVRAMSALPPKADIGTQPRNVRFVPLTGIDQLSDHLIRADDERLRKGKAERFCGLEVKNQLEFRWLLDGKIGRLGAFEYFVGVGCGAAEVIGEVLSIRHQKSVWHFFANQTYSWQAVGQSRCAPAD